VVRVILIKPIAVICELLISEWWKKNRKLHKLSHLHSCSAVYQLGNAKVTWCAENLWECLS